MFLQRIKIYKKNFFFFFWGGGGGGGVGGGGVDGGTDPNQFAKQTQTNFQTSS